MNQAATLRKLLTAPLPAATIYLGASILLLFVIGSSLADILSKRADVAASTAVLEQIASERAGRMVVPIAFWFFSIGGGVLLFVYALYIRDPVFILGQAFGVFVYARNLYFELRDRRAAAATA